MGTLLDRSCSAGATRWAAISAALLLTATACTDQDTTNLVPVASGGGGSVSGSSGSGGSSELAGAAGAGTAGAGGSIVEPPDAGSVRFHALLQGDKIVLDILGPAWQISCTHTPSVLQKLGDTWTPLRDERPTGTNDAIRAHYLNGVYQSDCAYNSGCHVNACEPIIYDEQLVGVDDIPRLGTLEYVRVGERQDRSCDPSDAALDAGADAGLALVPEVESRAPTGPLVVRLRYYRDSDCQTPPITTDAPVE